MSILNGLLFGVALGIWLDIFFERWGLVLLDTYIGQCLGLVFTYIKEGMLWWWELIRFDIPRAIQRRK